MAELTSKFGQLITRPAACAAELPPIAGKRVARIHKKFPNGPDAQSFQTHADNNRVPIQAGPGHCRARNTKSDYHAVVCPRATRLLRCP